MAVGSDPSSENPPIRSDLNCNDVTYSKLAGLLEEVLSASAGNRVKETAFVPQRISLFLTVSGTRLGGKHYCSSEASDR